MGRKKSPGIIPALADLMEAISGPVGRMDKAKGQKLYVASHRVRARSDQIRRTKEAIGEVVGMFKEIAEQSSD